MPEEVSRVVAWLREQQAMYENMMITAVRAEKLYITGQRDAVRFAAEYIEREFGADSGR